MAEFKVVIANPKSGRCVQKELKDEAANSLIGKKLGEVIRGELLDLTGYEFKITGGSDYCGFPMRVDIPGTGRKKLLTVSGVGAHPVKKKVRKNKPYQFYPGTRQRKMVCGNTIHEKITQINLTVVKQGSTPLGDEPAPEAPKEEAKGAEAEAAPKVEEKKEAPKEEAKPEEKKEEAEPAEKKKPEAAKEEKPAEKKEEPKVEEKPKEEKKEEPKAEPAKEENPAEEKKE